MKRSSLLSLCVIAPLFIAGPAFAADAVYPSVPLQAYTYGSVEGSGTVINVAPNGNDILGTGSVTKPFATPGAASLHAYPGDVIVVKSGTYAAFGSLRHSGTDKLPIVVRPEPNGHAVFALKDTASGLEIAASHLRVYGFEIQQQNLTNKGACVSVTRPVTDLILRNLNVHDCDTGIRLSQPSASSQIVTMEDLQLHDLQSFGVSCPSSGGACSNIAMRRLKIANVGPSGTAISVVATSTQVFIEDSEIGPVWNGDGISLNATDVTVANTSLHQIGFGMPVTLWHGGSILNSDLRANDHGILLYGGGTYHVRGNLVENLARSEGNSVHVRYEPMNQDIPTALSLIANRLVIRTGGLDLPEVRENVPAPLMMTVQSNTFFFGDASATIRLPQGREVGPLEFASVTGTGIVNKGANISVTSPPTPDDLQSPIFTGGQIQMEPLGTLVFPGVRIKGSGPAIYLYAADGKRHAFPNEAVYRSWFSTTDGKADFTNVLTIDDAALAQVTLGKNVTYRPGMRLVKIATDPKVYAVGQEATLRWVQTEEAATALYGANWARQVDDIPDTFFSNYIVSEPIARSEDFVPAHERAEVVNPSDLFPQM